MTALLGSVRAGDVLAGKYRVERVVGAGGMGVVVAATHQLLRERVAVKLLSPERARDRRFVRRFLSEARSTAKLRSDHAARVYDVGTLDDGTPFLVMELLEGCDLAFALREGGPLAPAVAVEYVRQACAGLAPAHALGIVHRDLKPANLFLTRRPDGSPLIKVLDFGLAKRSPDDSVEATRAGHLVGSPSYMAPEQVAAPAAVDGRTDVWALGVILYELLTGERPFTGDTVSETFARILHGPAPSLRDLAPDASPALAAVVARCLEKDRDRRFDSVGALRDVLGLAASAVPEPPSAASAVAATPDVASTLVLAPHYGTFSPLAHTASPASNEPPGPRASGSHLAVTHAWVWPLRTALALAALATVGLVALRPPTHAGAARREALGAPNPSGAPSLEVPLRPAAPKPVAIPSAPAVAPPLAAPNTTPPRPPATEPSASPASVALPTTASPSGAPPGAGRATAPPRPPRPPPARRAPDPRAAKEQAEKASLFAERTW